MAYTLNVEIREEKNPKALRRAGQIPGVVYGRGYHQQITIPKPELEKLLSKCTRSSRIALSLGGEEMHAFIKEIHYNPLNDRVMHVDLFRPEKGVPVKMDVPIRYSGEPAGRKKGGAVNRLRDSVQVIGPSDAIPEILEIDITSLDIGDSIHVGEVSIPSGVELLTPGEVLLVQVMIPRKIEEPTVAAEGAEGAPAEGEAAAEGAEGGAKPESTGESASSEGK